MKQHIRNKVKEILDQQSTKNYELFYSSLLDQLYVLYIVVIAIGFLLLAHLSMWPVIILLVYILTAYLFGAFRNNSFALNDTGLIIINGRKPFVKTERIEYVNIKKIVIAKNANPVLDRIFIIPSNLYIQVFYKQADDHNKWYTNLDFEIDAKVDEKSIEDFINALQKKGVEVDCLAKRDDDEL